MTTNLYAYTYPSAVDKFPGYILTKVGDSIRDVDVRMGEQGGAAEYETKIRVGAWNNLQKIARDYDVHKVLDKRGLHHQDGKGTEWFIIPGETPEDARTYLDAVIEDFEGKKIRNKVIPRIMQEKTLNQAMEIIATGKADASMIANLCPRFGKTLWSLMLFNKISEKYGNRVMLLPAYWLSVHSSFENELGAFDDFLDLVLIDPNDENAEQIALAALDAGQRIVIPVSLHGEHDVWTEKHKWISDIANDDIFMFADEGDFGTHADNQVKKLDYILKMTSVVN